MGQLKVRFKPDRWGQEVMMVNDGSMEVRGQSLWFISPKQKENHEILQENLFLQYCVKQRL